MSLASYAYANPPVNENVGPASGIANPLQVNTFIELLLKLADLAVQVGIPIAGLFIVYAGFQFVTARGDTKQLEEAKKMFFWVVAGTFLILGAKLIIGGLVGTVQGLK